MNQLHFPKPLQRAQAIVIVILFFSLAGRNANSTPLSAQVAVVILPTLDDLKALKEAQSIVKTIRRELEKNGISVPNTHLSQTLTNSKSRSWLQKCETNPKCLQEIGTKLNASLIVSGSVQSSARQGPVLKWNITKTSTSQILATEITQLSSRTNHAKFAERMVNEFIMPQLQDRSVHQISLVPSATSMKLAPQDPQLVLPPTATKSTESTKQNRSPLFWGGVATAGVGSALLLTASIFRVKSALTQEEIDANTSQVDANRALKSAQNDFDLSLQLVVSGTLTTLIGSGLLGMALVFEANDTLNAQLEIGPNSLKVVGKF